MFPSKMKEYEIHYSRQNTFLKAKYIYLEVINIRKRITKNNKSGERSTLVQSLPTKNSVFTLEHNYVI